jgi:uncharacterized protein YciW
MGKAGRRRVETQFDLRVTVSQTTELMERLVHAAHLAQTSHRTRARKDQ